MNGSLKVSTCAGPVEDKEDWMVALSPKVLPLMVLAMLLLLVALILIHLRSFVGYPDFVLIGKYVL